MIYNLEKNRIFFVTQNYDTQHFEQVTPHVVQIIFYEVKNKGVPVLEINKSPISDIKNNIIIFLKKAIPLLLFMLHQYEQ
jgi:hypothetical protein